jgi:hypothetical protein
MPDTHSNLSLEILIPHLFGTWLAVHQVTIGLYQRYTFYSGTRQISRTAQGVGGSTIEHNGIGVAWTPSPKRVTQ